MDIVVDTAFQGLHLVATVEISESTSLPNIPK